ncbi:hypothetical protein EYD00_07250 [Agrobacterium sp. 33MFTa1.1]|uniref:hypothetical protein n=1 Tax=Agrobacterium sp. 33MFTa1.1 TaxID=1279031 RepID=UPI00103B090C|nr:hypothetical protein [Agrobacterium sp. 33MFTa1.1]QBJ13203.1 hypothetical protein EYD00_07250 [Agrobacterium sp. 33MFTa1.1]
MMLFQRHQQLFRHDPDNGVYGDCFRTVVACLLCVDPVDVPHVCNGPDDGLANDRMREFLTANGIFMIGVAFDGAVELERILEIGEQSSGGLPWMLTGQSTNGVNHVVICQGASITHDTSIDQSGIVGPTKEGWWWMEWIVRAASSGRAAA